MNENQLVVFVKTKFDFQQQTFLFSVSPNFWTSHLQGKKIAWQKEIILAKSIENADSGVWSPAKNYGLIFGTISHKKQVKLFDRRSIFLTELYFSVTSKFIRPQKFSVNVSQGAQ